MGDHSGKTVTVTSPDHNRTLVDGLWRLLTAKHGLDFDLKLGGRSIRAHQLVVDVFLSSELINRDANDHQYSRQADISSSTSVDVLTCASEEVADCLEPLLEFLYRGTVSVELDRVQALAEIAKQLDFKILIDAVESAMPPPSSEPPSSSEDDGANDNDENDADFNIRRPQAAPTKRKRGRWPVRQPAKTAVGRKLGLRKVRPSNRVVKRDDFTTRSQFRVVLTSGDGDFDADAVNGGGSDDEEEAMSAEEEQKVARERARRRMYARRRRQGVSKVVAKALVDPNQILQCQHCEYKCRNQNRMRIHQAKHDPNINVHRCELCSRGFLSADKLARHLAKHTTSKCPHCDFETPRPTAYYQHLYSQHKVNSTGQPLQQSCPSCDFKCVMPSQLRRHWTRRHTSEKPFRCELCQYSSVTKEDVNKHVRRVHLAIKPFTCDICNHSCATRYHLNRHRQTHLASHPPEVDPFGQPLANAEVIKIFVCHVCGHSCNRQDNLRVHIKNVHKLAV